jgi:deoxyhypusine synthase
MIDSDVTICMGLAGAMVPAGMRSIIAYLIENRFIDVLVSTGANLFHDLHESLGGTHYKGSHLADDNELFKHGVDRIYDVFAQEKEFRKTDMFVADFADKLEKDCYPSREFLHLLGKKLAESGGKKSILTSAYKHGVPIYCPAIADSSIGIGLAVGRRLGKKRIQIDTIADVEETTDIVIKSKGTGVIYLGGGVPKNFIQQTEITSSILGVDIGGHEYAIQITTDSPHWGGLSGCTFEEAQSWGKIAEKAKKAIAFCDITIGLPIVVHALVNKKRRRIPKIGFDNGVSVK